MVRCFHIDQTLRISKDSPHPSIKLIPYQFSCLFVLPLGPFWRFLPPNRLLVEQREEPGRKKKDSLIRSDSVELLSLDRVHLDELYHPLLGTYTHPSSSPIGFVTDVHSRSRAAHYAYKPPEQHIRQALCVRCSTSRNLYGSILARTETALRMCFYINARSRDTAVYSRLHGRVSTVAFTWMRTEMATMPFGESSASL